MSTDLRFRLGQASVESKKRLEASSSDVANVKQEWPYRSWAEAINAFSRYNNLPDLSFPVIISQKGGSINTPESLQEVANLSKVPEAIDATIVNRTGDAEGQNVQVALIGWEEVKLLKKRTDFKQTLRSLYGNGR